PVILFRIEMGWWLQFRELGALHPLGGDGGGRRMKQRRQLLMREQEAARSFPCRFPAADAANVKGRQLRLRECTEGSCHLSQSVVRNTFCAGRRMDGQANACLK